jgi:Zn finger protein HypA/HybF involved in hydrogenase expression
MHDFLLAKEIISELENISAEKNISSIKKVCIEIGQISLAHDGHPEHTEDISVENLEFGLKSIAKNTPFEGARFEIEKTSGEHWKITGIEI